MSSSVKEWKLRSAATVGDVRAIEYLISEGVNLEAKDSQKCTALMNASREGRTDIVELLLKHGVNPNVSNEKGRCALSYAAREGHDEVLDLLLSYGADVDHQDEEGTTALDMARSRHRHTIIKRLEKSSGGHSTVEQKVKPVVDGSPSTKITEPSPVTIKLVKPILSHEQVEEQPSSRIEQKRSASPEISPLQSSQTPSPSPDQTISTAQSHTDNHQVQVLKVPTHLQTVRKAVFEARSQWKDIGRALNITEGTIDSIHEPNDGESLTTILKIWMHTGSATIHELLTALKDETVARNDLAVEILEREDEDRIKIGLEQ